MEIVPGSAAPATPPDGVLPGEEGRGGHRPGPAQRRPSLDENNQPAVSFTLNTDGAAQVRQGHGREHRPLTGDHPRQPRAVSAPRIDGRITDQGRITGSFTHGGGRRTWR